MKKSALISAAAVCLTSFTAFAQSAQDYVSMTFPYEVTVGKTVLPAGDYVFHRINPTNNVVTIYSIRDSKAVGTFVAIGAAESESSDKTEAVLKRIGDRYYMEELRVPGQPGFQVHVPASER